MSKNTTTGIQKGEQKANFLAALSCACCCKRNHCTANFLSIKFDGLNKTMTKKTERCVAGPWHWWNTLTMKRTIQSGAELMRKMNYAKILGIEKKVYKPFVPLKGFILWSSWAHFLRILHDTFPWHGISFHFYPPLLWLPWYVRGRRPVHREFSHQYANAEAQINCRGQIAFWLRFPPSPNEEHSLYIPPPLSRYWRGS